jgi:hypothetical protein
VLILSLAFRKASIGVAIPGNLHRSDRGECHPRIALLIAVSVNRTGITPSHGASMGFNSWGISRDALGRNPHGDLKNHKLMDGVGWSGIAGKGANLID